MASPEEIGDHKFRNTQFLGENKVRHTTFLSDPSLGARQRSLEGKQRAVKVIAKDRNSTIKIDYNRELMAMATFSKHDNLFVQFFGWYENVDYVYIAMEYMSHGDLRNYLEKERSEDEAKAVTRQLLEGLVIIHQERFAHRDLKPENVFVVSVAPVRVKIGDFGLAKLARNGTAFRTEGGTRDYIAPEVAGTDPSRETSEYTNAIDIWALGCITHEMLTKAPPFRGWRELNSYRSCPKLPRNSMLSKNISKNGIEFVEKMLAYPPERRIAAKEALDSEWLRLGDERAAGLGTGESLTGPALSGELAPSGAAGVSGESEGVPSGSAVTASQTHQLLVANGINPNHLTPQQFAAFQGQNPITQHKYLQQYAQSVAANTGRAVSALKQQGGPIFKGMPNMAQNPPNHGSPMMPQTTEGETTSDYYANPAMRGGMNPGAGNHALQDYQMQLMLLDQQNKKRLMMARAEQDNHANPPMGGMNPGIGNRALQEYQMQAMLLEQQNKQRLMMARAEQDNHANPPMRGMNPGIGNRALQEYQMQAMLLEQQNKKRLMMARAGRDNLAQHGDSRQWMEQAFPQSMSPGSRAAPSPQPTGNPKMRGTPEMQNQVGPGSRLPDNQIPAGVPHRGSPASMGAFNGRVQHPHQNMVYTRVKDMGMMGATQGGGASNGAMMPTRPGSHPGFNGQMGLTNMAQINAQMRGQQAGRGAPQVLSSVWQQQQAQAHVQAQQQQQQSGGPQPPQVGTPQQARQSLTHQAMPPLPVPAGATNNGRTQPSSPRVRDQQPATPTRSHKASPKRKGARDTGRNQRPTKKRAGTATPAVFGSGAPTSEPQDPDIWLDEFDSGSVLNT